MAFLDLAVAILQQIGAVAVQDARFAGIQRGAMLIALKPLATGFDAVNGDIGIVEEGMKQADGVGAAAQSGDQRVRQPAFGFHHLLFRLRADHRLEVAHHSRIRVRAGHRADAVERVGDVRHPIAQRLVHGVF